MAGPPVSKGFITHTKSSWQLVTSSTTQTDTGLTAFNIFLKELDSEMECICSKFLGYMETVKRLEGRLLLTGTWTSWRKGVKLMRITNAKSCIWEGKIPHSSAPWGLTAGEQLCREGPVMDNKLNISQQYTMWRRRPSVYWAELTRV